jgi:CHAT domain-containing protein/tetratricopeptide (TPR) repeat protein
MDFSETDKISEVIENAVAVYLEKGDPAILVSDRVSTLLISLEEAFESGLLQPRSRLCDAFAWAVWCTYQRLREPAYFRLAFSAFDPGDEGRRMPASVSALGLLAADRSIDLRNAIGTRDQLIMVARATQEPAIVLRAAQLSLAIACMMPQKMLKEQVKLHVEAGQLFYEHYQRTTEGPSLVEAYATFKFAFAYSNQLPSRGSHLCPDHMMVLTSMHDLTGDAGVLQELIEAGERARAKRRKTGARHAACLSMLGSAYRHRFEAFGDPEDVVLAVELAREAVGATAKDDANWFVRRANLAAALLASQVHRPERASLSEAIDLLRESAAGEHDRPYGTTPGMGWTNLALAYLKAFELFGDRAAVDAAIQAAADAVGMIDETHPQAGRYYWHLGIALQAKWRLEGDSTALESAFLAARISFEQTPIGHPYRPERMILVAYCVVHLRDLGYRTESNTVVDLLSEAEAELRRHLTLSRVSVFSALSATALRGWKQDQDVGILSAAAGLLKSVVDLLPSDDETGRVLKVDLAILEWALRSAGETRIDTATLLSHLRTAVEVSSSGARVRCMKAAAPILFDLSVEAGDLSLENEALHMLVSVAESPDAEPDDRYDTAMVSGTWFADKGRFEEALRLFTIAVDQMPLMSGPGLRRKDQERQLARMPGAATDAAACAILTRDPVTALQILERGRNLLGSQILHTQVQIERLRTRSPKLADGYEALQRRFRQLHGPGAAREVARPGRYPELREELSSLLAQIRSIDGFTDFHTPRGTVRSADVEGCVVTVNVSQYGSTALLTTSEGTRAVPLPDLTQTNLVHHVDLFTAAIRARRTDRERADRDADTVLRWLWDAVAEPALDALGIGELASGRASPQRVWWIPTGALSFLPIHAAGHHDRRAETVPPTVLDRCVSSYAVSLEALSHVNRLASSARRNGRGLIVAVADPPLANVALEAAELRAQFPDATVLSGADATPEAVLRLMSEHAWVHFACHARSDVTDPSSNGLVLYGGEVLTVNDLLDRRQTLNRMAFLSACDTGLGGADLADEAIHLASAMQISGFPHTIGTLWAVRDRVSRLVAQRIYRTITSNGEEIPDFGVTALALNDVIKELRDARPLASLQWAPFLHYGP